MRPASKVTVSETFISTSDQASWSDGNWLFPRALRLLEIPEFRNAVLLGIVISIGSKTDSTVSFFHLSPESCTFNSIESIAKACG